MDGEEPRRRCRGARGLRRGGEPGGDGNRRCTSGWAWACSWFSWCTRPCTPTGWPTPCVRLSPGPRWRARATWCSTRFRSSRLHGVHGVGHHGVGRRAARVRPVCRRATTSGIPCTPCRPRCCSRFWWCTWPCMRSGSRPGSGRGRPAAREGGKRREPAVRRQAAGVVAGGPLRPHGGRNGPLLNHATASPPPPDGGRASSPAFPVTRRHVGSS